MAVLVMKKICLVTYTRAGEGFTKELEEISEALFKYYGNGFKAVICCETLFDVDTYPYTVEIKLTQGTKYRRLIELMEDDDSEYYLSVDNDITGNINDLLDFVNEVIGKGMDIGWGRIRARYTAGLISNLVAVDKLLSHDMIRPLLWKCGCGISVPGQVFCIKASVYKGNLIDLDTFLDDVALGLYSNVHSCKRYITKNVLGLETPNSTFKGLWMQRSRWAKGYASIYLGTKNNKQYKKLVIIHGLSYHASWLIVWMILFGAMMMSPFLSLALWIGLSACIARNELKKIGYTMVYILFFPIFHIRWAFVFFNEIR